MKLGVDRSHAGRPESIATPTAADEPRDRRRRLAEFVRRIEPSVHGATGTERERIRRLLGWDDESLHELGETDVVIHTSPHASMNAFEPGFAFPWLAARLASSPPAPSAGVHLRTSVTHNNLGDLRWRPYAWWRRSADGSVAKTRIFSRSAKSRHDALFAKETPELPVATMSPLDSEATRLASHARDYATFCLLYRTAVERHAGLHGDRPLIDVPLALLNAFTFHEDGLDRWRDMLAELGMSFRTTDARGRLVEVSPDGDETTGARPLLCPNAVNLAQAYLLGISCMIGAERMAKYVPEMGGVVTRLFERLGTALHRPELVTLTELPIAEILEHDEETVAAFAADGLRGSLPVGAADIGSRVADNLDRSIGAELTDLLGSAKNPLAGSGRAA